MSWREEAKPTWSDVFSRSDEFQDSGRNKDTKSKTDTGGSFANSRSIIKAAKRVSSTLKRALK
jgi:hypothetical protein